MVLISESPVNGDLSLIDEMIDWEYEIPLMYEMTE
jgi:hypothetical protein